MSRWNDFTESELLLIRDSLENSLGSYMHYDDALPLIEGIDRELSERGLAGD